MRSTPPTPFRLRDFLVDEEAGNAALETVMIAFAVLPTTVIPAACGKMMSEYYAYTAIVLGSPFM